MRNTRLKTEQHTNPANCKVVFNILTPSLFEECDLKLNLPETLLLSAIFSEINEVISNSNNAKELNKFKAVINFGTGLAVKRQMKPNYLLHRYPLLHFSSTKRIKQLRLSLFEKGLIDYSDDYIKLEPSFYTKIFTPYSAIRGVGFIIVPQYAIITHDTIWQLSPTHIIIGIAIIRILQTRGLTGWIDANMLQKITGLNLGYRQFIRYIEDLINLNVLSKVKESSQRFILSTGKEGRYLLIENDIVMQTNARLFLNAS